MSYSFGDDEAPSYRPELDPNSPEFYYVPKSCYSHSKRAKTDDEDEEDVGEDRISSLPNETIHHIFSFMDMTEVIQTSILSTRWRYIWKCNPNLNFDSELMDMYFDPSEDDDWDNDDFYARKEHKFKTFLNKTLNHLEKKHIIHDFRFKTGYSLKSRDLKGWLDSILKGDLHVKNLYLNATVSPPFQLPSRLFSSELSTLKLVSHRPCMQLPNAMFSVDGIRKLDFMYVKFPKGDEDRKLVLSCPVLEDAKLCECQMGHLEVFTIRAPLLKNLVLLSNEYLFCALCIDCPALISVMCSGYLNRPWSLENLSALTRADISFKKDRKQAKELFHQYLGKVLKGICGVKTLEILALLGRAESQKLPAKGIVESPELLEMLPNNFQSLRHIVVDESHGDMRMLSIPSVANILRRLPHVEAFNWKRMPYLRREYGYDDEEEGEVTETDMQVQCIFSGLKSIEIENFHGVEDEVKFLGFLLKSAASLEKMIIIAITKDRTKFKKVSDKLLALPRASSCVIVIKAKEHRKVEVFCTSEL